MAASNRIDRQTFLAYLRQSGLVSDEQLAEIARQHADQTRGRLVARALVAEGVLTRFQAERILAGRTSGFLLGQYRILEQIGRGGMGRVYKAQHRTMQRMVALKVLAPDLLATDRAVEMFLHEVRAVAQIVHPNIVTAFDANETNGRYYLVLEYVDGPNLDELVRTQGPLSVGLACDYIRQVATGLQCAHLRGMIHRDIKPANLLVQWHGPNGDASGGLVKISDFGLARVSAPVGPQPWGPNPHTILTKENTVMGTPDYLSPEQSRNLHKTDIRSDLYSLGCTFYFLLAGRVPFPGGNAMDKLIRHSTEHPTPITEMRGDVPAPVLAVLDKLLAKHPNDRFQTPAELIEALHPWAVPGPTPGRTTRSGIAPLPESAANEMDEQDPADNGEQSDGELGALVNTVSNDHSPTPRLAGNPAARPGKRRGRRMMDRLRIAVISAIAVVTGVLAVSAAVALYFR
jgi:serine/threonine-protein kinase